MKEVCDRLREDKEARESIRQQLLQGRYRPEKVRTTQIPKANGKTRTLGIATVQDRIVQTMILQVVTANLPEDTWSEHSYAYRPKRSVAEAIAEVNRIRSTHCRLSWFARC